MLDRHSPSCVGPVDVVVSPAAGPRDSAVVHFASGPEVLLSVGADQAGELPLLGAGVDGDRLHSVVPAELLPLALGEGGAAQSPGDKVILTLEFVVWPVASTTPSSSSLLALSTLPSLLAPSRLASSPTFISALATFSQGLAALSLSTELRGGCSYRQTSQQEDNAQSHLVAG